MNDKVQSTSLEFANRLLDAVSQAAQQLPNMEFDAEATRNAATFMTEFLCARLSQSGDAPQQLERTTFRWGGGVVNLRTAVQKEHWTNLRTTFVDRFREMKHGGPERAANDLGAISAFGKHFDELDGEQKQVVIGDGDSSGIVQLCCFHPAYGYEDFLEGYRPRTVDGQVTFDLRDGVFKKLCKDAKETPDRNFYLIVDEINRGDIPRIFGELLTTLEKDKRGKRIVLPVSQDVFTVPKNVFLIGTMNTADRSISLLDAALRRRFGFVEMMQDGTVLRDSNVSGIPLRAWFDALNKRIRQHVGRDARNLQIGHSYLMQSGSPIKEIAPLKRAIRDDIIPLLEEYCYEDYGTLGNILGEDLVDVALQRIRHELFDDGQEANLVQALLAPCPDISTSTEAISSDESSVDEDVEEDDDNGADDE